MNERLPLDRQSVREGGARRQASMQFQAQASWLSDRAVALRSLRVCRFQSCRCPSLREEERARNRPLQSSSQSSSAHPIALRSNADHPFQATKHSQAGRVLRRAQKFQLYAVSPSSESLKRSRPLYQPEWRKPLRRLHSSALRLFDVARL